MWEHFTCWEQGAITKSVIGPKIKGVSSQRHSALVCELQRTPTSQRAQPGSLPFVLGCSLPSPQPSTFLSASVFLAPSPSTSVPECTCAGVSIDGDWVCSCASSTVSEFSPAGHYHNRKLFSDFTICCSSSIKFYDSLLILKQVNGILYISL